MNSIKRHPATARGALTLVEILVSLVIVTILAGIVLVTGNMVRSSRMRATAEQQMAMIASAIEQYATFWPRWEVADTSGEAVLVADKGWPDFIPGRLFDALPSVPVFEMLNGFNDHWTFNVDDIVYSPSRDSFDDPDDASLSGDVLNANACLAYCLTAASGKGPFIEDKPGAGLVEASKLHKQPSPPAYPRYTGLTSSRRREVFVDPWGVPYRYFWVYRDPEPDPDKRAYKGFLPVDYGPYWGGDGDGGVNNPAFFDDKVTTVRKKAATFVLESAGPNKMFGGVWKRGPTQQDLDRAWDNLTVMP